MLPSEILKLPTDLLVTVFPAVWKLLLLHDSPRPGWVSIPNSFVSLFVFYILSYLLLKRMGCFSWCLVSSASVQKLFCGSCSVVSDSLQPYRLQPARLLHSWDFPGKNTEVGCHFLLQGIFPTQGWNPGLPHCRRILYQLSHKGNPRILQWVAHPFSRESSPPRNQSRVS